MIVVVLACCASTAIAAGWKAEGWIQGAANASSAERSNLPFGFPYFAGDLQLDQAWLRLDRKGMRLDVFAGTDYAFTRARGLFARQSGDIGFDPIQFYIEGHSRGIGRGTDVRIGRFTSPIGAEYNDGPSNVLASHSYAFIYDPFTHTGVYASTALDADWTLLNGIVTGSDVFVDPAARPTYINGARWIDHADTRRSAQLVTILGPGRFDVEHGFNHVDVYDLVVTTPLAKKFLLTLHAVHGREDAVPGLGDVDWLGVVPYLTWTLTDTVSSTLRLEHFDDDEGNRTGFAGTYRTATLGVAWKPRRWLMLRPEVRFDDHDGGTPFEGRSHLSTATLDFVTRW
jgi:hypothetical protein